MIVRFLAVMLLIAAPISATTVDEAIHARLAHAETVRVWVELAPSSQSQRRAGQAGVRAMHVLRTIPAMIATVTADGLVELAADPTVVTIAADRTGSGGLSTSVAQIRADRVRNRGITGAGSVVAVLDSGIDASHPDIAGAIVGEECFCAGGCCAGGVSRTSGPGSAAGVHPHGVHVTGIVASRGHVAPIGIAPGAGILAVRVLDDDNRGFLSDWLAALDWVAANRPDVRVINMSLVSDDLFTAPCDTANAFTRGFAPLAATLRRRGTLVVAASGNDGSTTRLTAPGCVRSMVTVGAVDATDAVAAFSNGGGGVDLVAPGVRILSGAPNGVTGFLSGTSMAAAHVSGALALLFEARPSISAPTTRTGSLVLIAHNSSLAGRRSHAHRDRHR